MPQKLQYSEFLLIDPQNYSKSLPSLKKFILTNKEHPDISKAVGEIAGSAIFNNSLEVLSIVHKLDYSLHTLKDMDGYLLPHLAADIGKNEAFTLLKKLGVNLEVKN